MKNLLENKLGKIAAESQKASDKIISDVTFLLENTAAEERETLRAVGLSHELDIADATAEDSLIRSKHAGILGKSIVNISEINTLCLKYRLAVKNPELYRGKIPADLGSELRRFCTEKKIVLSQAAEFNNFLIVAPPAMFKDYEKMSDILKQEGVAAIERRKVRKADPLLIYRIPNNPEYFAIIKGWGDDFSWRRRALGFLFNRRTINVIDRAINCICFSLPVYLLVVGIRYGYSLDIANQEPGDKAAGWYTFIGFILPAITVVAGWIYCFSEDRHSATRKIIDRISTKKYQ